MKNSKRTHVSRRRFVQGAGATSGVLMLQALATGIPVKVLLDPLSASADDSPSGRLLIVASSRQGDPINCNVPGTYVPGVDHADVPDMAETPMQLGTMQTSGAKVWADMPQDVLDRTAFIHHGTYTPVHGDMARVQRMLDQTENNDMLVSLLARETASALGTVQDVPLSLGASNSGELLSSQGRLLANVSPLSVKQALAGDVGLLKDLASLRDAQLDRIYKLYKERGTSEQRALLDSWAKARDDVRNLSESLTGRLQLITDNSELSQVKVAAVLAAMKISPVISIHLSFGGDNHNDALLTNEVQQHQQGVGLLVTLMQELDALQSEGHLEHGVVAATLNVFGRTLRRNATGGRDHNRNHHATVLMGSGIRPGVVGGIKTQGNDFSAMGIESMTGAPSDSADVPFEDTLGAVGKTLGALMGVSQAKLDGFVARGKPLECAIA